MFAIEIHEDALAELEKLRAFHRNRILDDIEEQLAHEPCKLTRRRKILESVEPPWDQVGPVWQLRVGDYRVFYDVLEDEKLVIVQAVRRKPQHKTTKKTL